MFARFFVDRPILTTVISVAIRLDGRSRVHRLLFLPARPSAVCCCVCG
jgi:hypothetical protein